MLFCTVLLTTRRKFLKIAVVAQVLKFDTGPRAVYVFSSVLGQPYALLHAQGLPAREQIKYFNRFSRRTKRPTERTRQLRLMVNILETRNLKSTGHSTKPRTTTRLVLRESQITYGLVASFFFFFF